MTSPALFRPKSVGASLVVNALTKYIGGHGNALAGAVTDTGLHDWTRFPGIADAYKTQPPAMWGIAQIRKKGLRDWGGTLAAEQAHHIAVGAETLALRIERVCANAQALAERLAAHPKVRAVYYPGLASHPQHALAKRLFRGFGGLLAFELAEGIDCFDFLNRLSLVISSSNLGDNRTLAIPVAHTIFWEVGAERRAAMGIADSLIRVSVGIEDADDLIADFAQALASPISCLAAPASKSHSRGLGSQRPSAFGQERTSSERAPRAVFHLKGDDRSNLCATTSPRTDRLRRSAVDRLRPPILTLAGRIEDHHESDSQRAPLCRCSTSYSTWLTATGSEPSSLLVREEVGGQPRRAPSRLPSASGDLALVFVALTRAVVAAPERETRCSSRSSMSLT